MATQETQKIEGMERFLHLATGEGNRLVHYSESPLVLLDRKLTDGRFDMFIWETPKGIGPPLHIHHNEDEIFYILEGEMIAQVGNERVTLKPGSFCLMPKGVEHAYKVISDEPCRYIAIMSPSGFAEFCYDIHELSKDGREFKIEEALPIAQKHKLEVTGPLIEEAEGFS